MAALATSVLAGTLLTVPTAPAQAASASLPIMFGASGSSRELIESHERVARTKVRGARVYKQWDSPLFSASQIWARDTGHTLFLSIRSERRGGADVRFSAVANAKPGSTLYRDMQNQARQIKAFGAKVFITYNHEPDASFSRYLGTGPEFAAAWRKLVSVYRAEGVRNAESLDERHGVRPRRSCLPWPSPPAPPAPPCPPPSRCHSS